MSRTLKDIARSDAFDGGFSLFELLVVLTILTGVAVLWLPWMGSSVGRPSRTAVQSMALQLAADLRAARADALRTNVEQTFMIDLGNRMTWSLARPTARRFVDGVDIDVAGLDLEWTGDRAVQIRFFPTGAATGGSIGVRDNRSTIPLHEVRIGIDWLTGVARIERAR